MGGVKEVEWKSGGVILLETIFLATKILSPLSLLLDSESLQFSDKNEYGNENNVPFRYSLWKVLLEMEFK